MIRDVDQIKQTAEDEAYQNGMLMMRRFIREFPLREEEVLVWMQTEYLGSKDKEKDKRPSVILSTVCFNFSATPR